MTFTSLFATLLFSHANKFAYNLYDKQQKQQYKCCSVGII